MCIRDRLRTTRRKPRTLDENSYITFTSQEEALNWYPDVVLITNPTHLHIPIALKAATNNITINRNGSKIQGLDENMIIDVDRAGFSLVYYNIANGWLLMEK